MSVFGAPLLKTGPGGGMFGAPKPSDGGMRGRSEEDEDEEEEEGGAFRKDAISLDQVSQRCYPRRSWSVAAGTKGISSGREGPPKSPWCLHDGKAEAERGTRADSQARRIATQSIFRAGRLG
jgi:hypothetical protein